MMKVGANMSNSIKDSYEKIQIPEELPFSVAAALRKKAKKRNWVKYVSACACVFIGLFAATNLSPTFADTAADIPVISSICKIFTLEHYKYQDNIKTVNVTVPRIEVEGGSKWQNKLNQQILDTINQEKADAEQRAQEYYDAYIETGGKPEDFYQTEIVIDYEVPYTSREVASFKIFKYETRASFYGISHFYNINLNTGKILTLRDWIGNDYKNIVTEQVLAQIEQLDDEIKCMYFDNIDVKKLINDNTNFYIAPNGKSVVVVFDKYELAAGAVGEPEFTINF